MKSKRLAYIILTIIILVLPSLSHQAHSHDHTHQNTIQSNSLQVSEHDTKAQEIQEENQKKLDEQTEEQKVMSFFSSCQGQIGQWLSIPSNKTLERALWECYVPQNQTQLLNFYADLAAIGTDITKQHIDNIPKLFRKHKYVKYILKCFMFLAQFENKFFKEPKKLKYMMQFVRQHPKMTKDVFPESKNYTLKGQKFCYFMKVLFEFYYIDVIGSMETLATSFLRALTLRSDVFDHYDMSYCVSLESIGKISSSLQNVDINNVFIKMPEVFRELKYLKLKQKCKDKQNMGFMANLRSTLEGLDMFKIMYNDYEPWVQIASQKFGHTQIRLISRQFALILNHRQRYLFSEEHVQVKKDQDNQL